MGGCLLCGRPNVLSRLSEQGTCSPRFCALLSNITLSLSFSSARTVSAGMALTGFFAPLLPLIALGLLLALIGLASSRIKLLRGVLSMAEKAPKRARKPPESAARVFRAVAQCDFTDQMDVVRWLLNDPLYQLVCIKHDRDVYTAEEIQEQIIKREQPAGDYYTRTNGDGSFSQFRAGDVKPAHIHLLVRTTAKMRASTLSTRFCNQLHFQAVADSPHCARYLLHRTFDSRQKAQYEWNELFFLSPSRQILRSGITPCTGVLLMVRAMWSGVYR